MAPNLHATLAERAAKPDPAVEDWLEAAAVDLRWSVHMIETIFDPQTIILCGSAPESLARRLVAAIEPLLPSNATRNDRTFPRLQLGITDPWAVALGAAAEPIGTAFDPRFCRDIQGIGRLPDRASARATLQAEPNAAMTDKTRPSDAFDSLLGRNP